MIPAFSPLQPQIYEVSHAGVDYVVDFPEVHDVVCIENTHMIERIDQRVGAGCAVPAEYTRRSR